MDYDVGKRQNHVFCNDNGCSHGTQIGEDTEEYLSSFSVKPLKSDKLRKSLAEGSTVANDLNLSICRDVVNESSNKVVKRKITWQDQLALRV